LTEQVKHLLRPLTAGTLAPMPLPAEKPLDLAAPDRMHSVNLSGNAFHVVRMDRN